VTLDQAARRRSDNYLPLRHLAALMVIYGHSYALTRHAPGEADLVARLMPGFYAGNLAVYLFFAISGYLVTLSLLRNPGLWRYVRNRFLRVYPGYLACLLVCVFAIGLAFTALPAAEYLRAEETWRYVTRNLQPVTLAWTLPGVFEGNPYPKVVNGTLWSLSLEVRWYFYLGLLAASTIVQRRWTFTLLALSVLSLGAWQWWSGKPDVNEYRALSQTYLIAALCAQWRDRIPVAHWPMAGFALAAAFTHGSRAFAPAIVLAAIYFTFWVAYRLPALRWPGSQDYSYGLFLYGFPVQQSLVALFPTLAPLQLLPISACCALLLAMLSWHLVERAALGRYRRSPTSPPLPAV
jgi:peptidoglycan/LPS O-acetylase OafA/YrhL